MQIDVILNNANLSRIARRISPQNMSTIAIEQLGFSYDQLQIMDDECREDKNKYNRTILIKWRNKSTKHTGNYFNHN